MLIKALQILKKWLRHCHISKRKQEQKPKTWKKKLKKKIHNPQEYIGTLAMNHKEQPNLHYQLLQRSSPFPTTFKQTGHPLMADISKMIGMERYAALFHLRTRHSAAKILPRLTALNVSRTPMQSSEDDAQSKMTGYHLPSSVGFMTTKDKLTEPSGITSPLQNISQRRTKTETPPILNNSERIFFSPQRITTNLASCWKPLL